MIALGASNLVQPSIEEASISVPSISVVINTLTTGGFLLQGAKRNPGYMLLHVSRYDEFGTNQKYGLLIAENIVTDEYVQGAQIAAAHSNETLIIVGHGDIAHPHFEWERFINLFGGPVFNTSPLDPEFIDNLNLLGHDKLPQGLSGKADDLFEIFVHAALEFILGGRVVRYGQARRFEERPDGLAIPNPRFTALYDAKAYRDGYSVSANTIRQFGVYATNFRATYSSWWELNSFIVVSGSFQNSESTLRRRSQELLAKYRVPLSFLPAETLGKIISMLSEAPLLRRSIDWSSVFSAAIVDAREVEKQIVAIQKDGIMPRK